MFAKCIVIGFSFIIGLYLLINLINLDFQYKKLQTTINYAKTDHK